MPPARYTAIHTDAKLSAEDSARIYEWAHAEPERFEVSRTGADRGRSLEVIKVRRRFLRIATATCPDLGKGRTRPDLGGRVEFEESHFYQISNK
jgi:hypothetical protein